MAALAWVMMGIALWHFAVFVPDRFWGGIVGACVSSIAGAALLPMLVNGFSVPGRDETTIPVILEALPGAGIAMAICWWIGNRQERALEAAGGH